MGAHKVSGFHPFIFQKSGKSTIMRNLAVCHHFVAYLVFFSSIRVDPGPTNRGPTSLLALKIRTPLANMGKLRSIGQMPARLYLAIKSTIDAEQHAWSRQSCNMGKKWQISLQTIFFTKKPLSRHVNQVGQKIAEMVLWWSSFRIWSNGSDQQTNAVKKKN
jgi:hypothetical protein